MHVLAGVIFYKTDGEILWAKTLLVNGLIIVGASVLAGVTRVVAASWRRRPTTSRPPAVTPRFAAKASGAEKTHLITPVGPERVGARPDLPSASVSSMPEPPIPTSSPSASRGGTSALRISMGRSGAERAAAPRAAFPRPLLTVLDAPPGRRSAVSAGGGVA